MVIFKKEFAIVLFIGAVLILSFSSNIGTSYKFENHYFAASTGMNFIYNDSRGVFHYDYNFDLGEGNLWIKGHTRDYLINYIELQSSFPIKIKNETLSSWEEEGGGSLPITVPKEEIERGTWSYNFTFDRPLKGVNLRFDFTANTSPQGYYHFATFSNDTDWKISLHGRMKCSELCFVPYESSLLSIIEDVDSTELTITELDDISTSNHITFHTNFFDPNLQFFKDLLFALGTGLIISIFVIFLKFKA